MTGDDSEPVLDQAWLKARLETLNQVIATSMASDFQDPIDQHAIEGDHFRSVLFGLAMMVDDINSSRRQLEEQNTLNRTRAELWRLAADSSLDEHELIQQLLNTLGPVLGVSRACYNVIQGTDFINSVEWCVDGVKPTLHSKIPLKIVKYFLKDGFTELDHESMMQRLPGVIRPFADMFVHKLMESQNIDSIVYIPYKIGDYEEGGIIFDICRDHPVKPEWTEQKKQLVHDAVSIISLVIEQRRTREELVKSHGDLERRVRQRTTELHEANATLESSLQEKEVLLKEIHHRVKNNLQVISSLLNLQSRHLTDPRDGAMFIDSQSRIKSMALIHERLYQTGDLARVRFDTYIERLVADLFHTYTVDPGVVECTRNIEPVEMTVDRAIPCSLIVNELVSNALKYAFKERKRGRLIIALRNVGGTDDAVLEVKDDGPGLPVGVDTVNAESLGLQLVHTLADQLDGELTVSNDPGASFVLQFPLNGR